jgi:hypothetical protein
MWHGAAQTTAGYVQGISQLCHGSSAGAGPCLKRIITVFALAEGHPLAGLTAVQRLQRVGIEVHALEARHALDAAQPPPQPVGAQSQPPPPPPPPQQQQQQQQQQGAMPRAAPQPARCMVRTEGGEPRYLALHKPFVGGRFCFAFDSAAS